MSFPAGDGSKNVTALTVRRVDLKHELSKPETGALSLVMRKHENDIEAFDSKVNIGAFFCAVLVVAVPWSLVLSCDILSPVLTPTRLSLSPEQDCVSRDLFSMLDARCSMLDGCMTTPAGNSYA